MEQILHAQNLVKAIIVRDGEEVSLETVSEYHKPGEQGNVLIKAVVFGGGKLTLKGMIRIGKRATGANAFLRQNVLVVGDKAQATAIPMLEIETDEVKASHAATVGKLDDEQLFYLMSKGIPEAVAKNEIITAFLAEAVEQMEDGEEKEQLVADLRGMMDIGQ